MLFRSREQEPRISNQTTVNVSMPGPYYIREEADIRRLADEIGAVLAGQAHVNRRMSYDWVTG